MLLNRADRHGRPRSIHVVIRVYGGRGREQGAKRGRGGAVRGQGLAASAIDKLSELDLTGFSAVLPGPDDGKDKQQEEEGKVQGRSTSETSKGSEL